MKLKHSVMVPLMGRQADCFHEYRPPRGFAERPAMVKRLPAAGGIEVVYAQDFADPRRTVTMIQDSGLLVSAVNPNV
jgi:hypothetical protein